MGGGGNDSLIGGAGADSMDGGMGVNTVSYATSTAAVTVNLATNINTGGDAAGDKLSNIQVIIGSNLNDSLTGSAAANTITGGVGNDTIMGGGGADSLDGGTGVNTVSYAKSTAVNINLATNTNGGGEATGDKLYNFQAVIGSNYNDTLTGSTGAETLTGGAGADVLFGGGGKDIFVFNTTMDLVKTSTHDVIGDFVQGNDIIQFTGALKEIFLGTSGFTGVAGQFNYAYSGNNTVLSFDNDGDKNADGFINLTGKFVLTASDFMF